MGFFFFFGLFLLHLTRLKCSSRGRISMEEEKKMKQIDWKMSLEQNLQGNQQFHGE